MTNPPTPSTKLIYNTIPIKRDGTISRGNHFVNLWQSNDERLQKYYLARSHGLNSYWARTVRDWRLCRLEELLHINKPPPQ